MDESVGDRIIYALLGEYPGDGLGWTKYRKRYTSAYTGTAMGGWREEEDEYDNRVPLDEVEWTEGHDYDHAAVEAEIVANVGMDGYSYEVYVSPEGRYFESVARAWVHEDEERS